jgi:hypothetical protein
MPFPITTATSRKREELWGKQEIEAKVARLWSSVDRK